MRCAPVLEDKNELVLAAIQRAHPAVVLGPHTEVLELTVGGSSGKKAVNWLPFLLGSGVGGRRLSRFT